MWEASVLESPTGGNQVFTDGQFMMDGRSQKDTRREIDTRRLNPRAAGIRRGDGVLFMGSAGEASGGHRLGRGWIDLIDGMGQDAR